MIVKIVSLQQDAEVEFSLSSPFSPGPVKWANYCIGVFAGLMDKDIPLAGGDFLFSSDVPLGGGLSSSASLEVATALAAIELADAAGKISDGALAKLCQQAENEFAAAPCGIMDQSISVMGKKGYALLMDCRSGQTKQIPFDNPEMVIIVVDTKVAHDIGDGGYPLRRRQCESAVEKLGISSLRDADEKKINASAKLDETEKNRARHVVREISRTLNAASVLENGDYEQFGKLMYASHASLKDDYEVSCDELDFIVSTAKTLDGVLGARMTGGGFGGCAIVLAQASHAESIAGKIAPAFAKRFSHPCGIFSTHSADGAKII